MCGICSQTQLSTHIDELWLERGAADEKAVDVGLQGQRQDGSAGDEQRTCADKEEQFAEVTLPP